MQLVKRWLGIICLGVIVLLTPQTTEAQRSDCTRDEAQYVRENPSDVLLFESLTMYTGSIKTNNQYDAFITAYRDNQFRWCRRFEKNDRTNTEALNITESGGRVFVTISTDRSTYAIDTYTANGWTKTYGLGSGPQAAVVLEIDKDSQGIVKNATYVISKTPDGLTNSVVVTAIQFYDFRVHIDGIASSYVLDILGNPMNYVECPRGSSFRYVLDENMSQILETHCNGIPVYSDGFLRNTGELPENLPESINPGGDFFSYCTDSQGILVMRINDQALGYEIFAVPGTTIGNGLQQAVETGQNIKLGEGDGISIWALSTDEIQFSTPDPYTFIVSKYVCGVPIVTGEAVILSTTENSELGTHTLQGASEPPTEIDTSLPIYRPSPLPLNDDGTYTIRSGDNLNTIASKLGVDVDVLAEYNSIDNKRFIQIGQVLQIPPTED